MKFKGRGWIQLLGVLFLGGVFLYSGGVFKGKPSQVTLYLLTSRGLQYIEPVAQAYKKLQPHVKLEVLKDKDEALVQKLKSGSYPHKDVLMVSDPGVLEQIRGFKVLSSLKDIPSVKKLSPLVKSEDEAWAAISYRARPIFYSSLRASSKELSQIGSYEDLGKPFLAQRLCLRTSRKSYNRSLLALLFLSFGSEKSVSVLKSWVKNLARPVYSSDREVLRAIHNGACDFGVANSYYYVDSIEKSKIDPEKVGWIWPKPTLVSLTGIGLFNKSAHPKEAGDFIEWLFSKEAQSIYVKQFYEFSVFPEGEGVKFLGQLKDIPQALISLQEIGQVQLKKSQDLAHQAGYD